MVSSYPLGKILLVDDDQHITDLLKFNLASEGFGVDVTPVAEDVEVASVNEYRLVIIDAMHQTFNGLDLCNEIKNTRNVSSTPVIICTEREDEELIIEAFDNGAEDFVAKPFSLRELTARIKAILRRRPLKTSQEHKSAANEIIVPGIDLVINTEGQKVTSSGTIIPLTKTEYQILEFLVKNRNSFYTRDDICNAVWKDEEMTNVRIVDTNISRLRKKLGEVGRHVINRYGMGYAFVDKPA